MLLPGRLHRRSKGGRRVPLVSDHSAHAVIAQARALARRSLLESDGYAVAADLGLAIPRHVIVESAESVTDAALSSLPGPRVVVKALAPDLPHKSAFGGVAVVELTREAVATAVRTMRDDLAGIDIQGFLVAEYITHSERPGAQILLGLRNTPDLGPVVTVGLGGTLTELLAGALDGGRAAAVFAPHLHSPKSMRLQLRRKTLSALLRGEDRGGMDALSADEVIGLAERLLQFAETETASAIEELEFNPIVLGPHGPTALDALVRLTDPTGTRVPATGRPLDKIDAMLRPQSAAIVGVSARGNPGRVILENMLAAGFPADRITVVKPGAQHIAGVRCVPGIEKLTDKVDLCVLAVAASDVPPLIDEIVARDRAESIVVVSGGIGERPGTDGLEARIRARVAEARRQPGGGPVINGANCLGIRSTPGSYDATFIPQYKRPPMSAEVAPLAIVAQSGAFMVSRASKLLGVNPRYMISVGNQLDLTVGDYLTYLVRDPAVRTVACYIEGFRPGDGARWLRAAADLVAQGRPVIAYRAGRTAEGVEATVSHTAAVAGDYTAFRELAESVGVLVADSLSDFDDLVRMHCFLDAKVVDGMHIGILSNAGFECVGAADHIGTFTLADLSPATEGKMQSLLDAAGLGSVVTPGNPVDTTPMLPDGPFADAVETLLADDAVDVAVVGCVPLTPALQTLPASPVHSEDLQDPSGVAQRLIALHRRSRKAWVAVVDAGPMYDPMVETLLASGVPVFRTVDRALAVFARYCAHRCRRRTPPVSEPVRPHGELAV